MKSLRIGITGGIGSGKSLVCKIFAQLGAPIYDADSRARNIMTDDAVLIDQIKQQFGPSTYLADGALNREYLAKVVFNNPEKLETLNKLVHPRVALDSTRWVDDHKEAPYTIKEAALLFESGSYKALDKIIVITAPEELRVARVMSRDKNKSREDVIKIIRSQLDEKEKVSRADYVIVNDESELLIPQVIKLHERFIVGIEK